MAIDKLQNYSHIKIISERFCLCTVKEYFHPGERHKCSMDKTSHDFLETDSQSIYIKTYICKHALSLYFLICLTYHCYDSSKILVLY